LIDGHVHATSVKASLMLAQEIVRIKRDGGQLTRAHIDDFVGGLVDGSWSEGQAAAMSMPCSSKA
jgi:thymidine phosphorylase